MKQLLIKILFKLLKVDSICKNILLYDDIKRVEEPEIAKEKIEDIEKKYRNTLSVALHTPYMLEWLYMQVVNKRREHIMTENKDKRDMIRATILFILYFIEEMKKADRVKLKEKREG